MCQVERSRLSLSNRKVLYSMVVWNLIYLFLRYLVAVYMTVSLMVIDTQ